MPHVMTDVLTPEQRHYNMSRIRGRDTKPEVRLRGILYRRGVRGYRVNYALTGKPDIVFTKKRLAIFVDGCFWHKCPLHYRPPASRTSFWIPKIEANVRRDEEVTEHLRNEQWTVLRFWEHEIRLDPEKVADTIVKHLQSPK